jgi:hypothetical protein
VPCSLACLQEGRYGSLDTEGTMQRCMRIRTLYLQQWRHTLCAVSATANTAHHVPFCANVGQSREIYLISHNNFDAMHWAHYDAGMNHSAEQMLIVTTQGKLCTCTGSWAFLWIIQLATETKISKLDLLVVCNEDVRGLDVPMQNVYTV